MELDLPTFLEAEEVKSPDLLLSICLIPSATRTAGLSLNFPQKDMWALTASSMVVIFRRLTSSLTASEQRPQSHLLSKLDLTSLMYACVQSSINPQHSHLTDSISIKEIKKNFNIRSKQHNCFWGWWWMVCVYWKHQS